MAKIMPDRMWGGRWIRLALSALLFSGGLSSAFGSPSSVPDRILVEDRTTGCFHNVDRRYQWQREGDAFVRDGVRLPAVRLEAIRKTVMDSRTEPKDLLRQLGFTPEALSTHHDALLALATRESWRDAEGKPLPLPPDLEERLSYVRLAPIVRHHLIPGGIVSTTRNEFTVSLPGKPAVSVHSEGGMPWMLPWRITVGAESWEVADPAVSLAMLELADSGGPSAPLMDGRSYSSDGLWKDDTLWGIQVGAELDRELSMRRAAELPGFAAFQRRFRVERAMTGQINLQPLSAHYEIASIRPVLVDRVWWWNPLQGSEPAWSWGDFEGAYDEVTSVAERHRWLAEWKAAGPDRHIEAHVVGITPRSETMVEELVSLAWKDARLAGSPDIELLLRRGSTACGTIFLASGEPRALITSVRRGHGSHWLDGLDFSFHPRAKPPTYAVVDERGRPEVRTMQGQPR